MCPAFPPAAESTAEQRIAVAIDSLGLPCHPRLVHIPVPAGGCRRTRGQRYSGSAAVTSPGAAAYRLQGRAQPPPRPCGCRRSSGRPGRGTAAPRLPPRPRSRPALRAFSVCLPVPRGHGARVHAAGMPPARRYGTSRPHRAGPAVPGYGGSAGSGAAAPPAPALPPPAAPPSRAAETPRLSFGLNTAVWCRVTSLWSSKLAFKPRPLRVQSVLSVCCHRFLGLSGQSAPVTPLCLVSPGCALGRGVPRLGNHPPCAFGSPPPARVLYPRATLAPCLALQFCTAKL